MSEQRSSTVTSPSVDTHSLFPDVRCHWLHEQVLQAEPRTGTLLPAAVIQVPTPGTGSEHLLDAARDLGLDQLAIGRPVLLMSSGLPCQDAPLAAVERFIASHPGGLHFCFSPAPVEWAAGTGIALVPVTLEREPVSNLVNWIQRFRVPAWCYVESGHNPWIEASASAGYLSALLLGADASSTGPELTRLIAGPCTPTGFESFEFDVVRHIVQQEVPLHLNLPAAQSFYRQALGTVVASSDVEQWAVDQTDDRAVILAPDASPGELIGLIIRDATGHAVLPVDLA